MKNHGNPECQLQTLVTFRDLPNIPREVYYLNRNIANISYISKSQIGEVQYLGMLIYI